MYICQIAQASVLPQKWPVTLDANAHQAQSGAIDFLRGRDGWEGMI